MSDPVVRLLLVAAFLVLFMLGLWLMRRSWRRRAAADADLLPLPARPPDDEESWRDVRPASAGLFVGTVHAGRWNDRVSAGGLSDRASGSIHLSDAGVTVERDGTAAVVIPGTAIGGAHLAPRLAGKVVGKRGLLVVAWTHHGVDLESGFRADDAVGQVEWAKAIAARQPTSRAAGEVC